MVIPNATIYTFRDLFEAKGIEGFEEHVAKLDDTARHFFERDFSNDKEYGQTKSQVRRRLMGVLENKTFERMFAQPQSKLDLFSEMNSGKVILIDTAKSLLKQSNTETFGRFFIALIAQAAQERAVIPEKNRMPTFVYIDEAADYFDQNIETILREARKYKVGMVLAHQYLGQLPGNLERAFSANTSIKFAGGVSFEDSKSLAGKLQCEASFIQRQPKLSFAAFVDAHTDSAISLRIPFGTIEQMPKMSKEQRKVLRKKMRKKYANPAKAFTKKKKKSQAEEEAAEADNSDAPPDNDVNAKKPLEDSVKHKPIVEEIIEPKKRSKSPKPQAKEPPTIDVTPQRKEEKPKNLPKQAGHKKLPPPDGDRPDTDPTPDW